MNTQETAQPTTEENKAAPVEVQKKQGKEAKKPKELTVKGVVKVALWLGLIGYLATSIPHVAWVYHTYDDTDINIVITKNLDSWVLSYFVAIGIDITIASLAYLLFAGVQNVKAFTVWVFLIMLSAMSWYFNYLYDMHANPVHQGDMWNISILFGLTTTGALTPIIVSSAPVIVLAYTFIMGVLGDTKKLSATEILAQATEQEALNIAKGKLRDAKRMNTTSMFTNVGGIVAGAYNGVKEQLVPHTEEQKAQGTEQEAEQKLEEELPDSTPAPAQKKASRASRKKETAQPKERDTDKLKLPLDDILEEAEQTLDTPDEIPTVLGYDTSYL